MRWILSGGKGGGYVEGRKNMGTLVYGGMHQAGLLLFFLSLFELHPLVCVRFADKVVEVRL